MLLGALNAAGCSPRDLPEYPVSEFHHAGLAIYVTNANLGNVAVGRDWSWTRRQDGAGIRIYGRELYVAGTLWARLDSAVSSIKLNGQDLSRIEIIGADFTRQDLEKQNPAPEIPSLHQ